MCVCVCVPWYCLMCVFREQPWVFKMALFCCSHFNWLLAPQPRLNGESFRDLSLSPRIVGCRCRRNCIPVSIQWLVWVEDGARVSLSLSWQWKLIPLPLAPFWNPLQHQLIRGHHETSRKQREHRVWETKIHTQPVDTLRHIHTHTNTFRTHFV